MTREALRYILARPRHTQLERFAGVAPTLSNLEYWYTLGHFWRRAYTAYTLSDQWLPLLSSSRPGREFFTLFERDRQRWRRLPEEITCYRGYGRSNRSGLFMSLELSVALDFAVYLRGINGRVDTFQVRKSDCLFRGGIRLR
jgi:hypothetical protein